MALLRRMPLLARKSSALEPTQGSFTVFGFSSQQKGNTMAHKNKLIAGLQTMMQILQSSGDNTEGQSEAYNTPVTVNATSKEKLIALVREMHEVACDLPSTDKQTPKTGLLSRFFDSPKTVQVYIAVDAPKGFDAAFIKLCKDLSYKCEINKHIHVLRHDVPLIVVCPITSRLEPDIDHALNGLDWQSTFIALVLHQGNEHSLPGLPTATKLPEKPKYENATFVDLAYSLESRLYPCRMNEDAKQKIKAFIDRFFK